MSLITRNGKLFLYILLVYFQYVSPIIIETNRIEDIMKYVDQETLVLLDLDETLITMPHLIGSDAWFYHTLKQNIKSGKSENEVLEELLPLTNKIHHHFWLEPVEENTVNIIKKLQNKSETVMVLTSRSITILERTLTQLAYIDLHLKRGGITDSLLEISFDKSDIYKTVQLKNGVIFCGKITKGKALLHILIHFGYFPKRIVFVDDKRAYLEDVQQSVHKMGIEFIGIRYGACDYKIKNFDPKKAQYELEQFKKVRA